MRTLVALRERLGPDFIGGIVFHLGDQVWSLGDRIWLSRSRPSGSSERAEKMGGPPEQSDATIGAMTQLFSQRLPEKMRTEREALDALLDATVLAHIGLVIDRQAAVFPTGFVRVDDALVIHGSTGSRWLRALLGQEVAVTVTKLDGVAVARSTFETSMHYRSAMVFGRFEPVAAEDQQALLDRYADRILPGRTGEVRAPTRKELAATTVLAMPIEQWSLRVSAGWPDDGPEDIAGDAWAGVVHLGAPSTTVDAAPDLRAGIEIPDSVRRLAAHPGRVC